MSEDCYIIPEDLQEYVEQHTSAAGALLRKLERDTHVNVLNPRMISGEYQGKLLEMISCMIRPARILEVGTFTGYSALCLAKGLQRGGRLISIEHNPELENRIRSYWKEAGLDGVSELKLGEALDILPSFEPESFDLIFLDADKEHYLEYYPLLKRILRPGGWLLTDNVLWSGKVYSPAWNDRETCIMRQFNDMVQADSETENIMLSVRDGLTLIQKRSTDLPVREK